MKTFHFFVFFLFFSLLIIQSALALGKKDKNSEEDSKTETVEEEKIPDEFIKIDFFLDTKKPNSKNHFNWQNSSAKYKDYFDTISGASKVHSTKNFREFTLDSKTKSLQVPKGLRNLCLFAVANPELLQKDNFSITSEGKKFTITFEHREIFYKIESDEKGFINVPDGFFIKQKSKNSTDSDKNKEEKNSSENSEKPEKNEVNEKSEGIPDFLPDVPQEKLNAIYKGKLNLKFSPEGILELNGKLKLAKNKKAESIEKNEKSVENSSETKDSAKIENSLKEENIEEAKKAEQVLKTEKK